MKKFVLGSLLLMGLAVFVRAGTPLDQPLSQMGQQGPYSNATLWQSTWSTSGAVVSIVFAATTKVSGSTTYSGRNCLTGFDIQMSTGTQFYILDGGTTNYYLNGLGNGSASLQSTIRRVEQHLEPLCGTAGNSLTLSMPAVTGGTLNVINAEGYTTFPPSANAGN